MQIKLATEEQNWLSFILRNFFFPKISVERALVIQERTASSEIKPLPPCPVLSSGQNTNEHKEMPKPFGSQQRRISDVKAEMGN